MTLEDATAILQNAGIFDCEVPLTPWAIRWVDGTPTIFLHGQFTADVLEAVAVWMRHHAQASSGQRSGEWEKP